jgi:hypothetical protein
MSAATAKPVKRASGADVAAPRGAGVAARLDRALGLERVVQPFLDHIRHCA